MRSSFSASTYYEINSRKEEADTRIYKEKLEKKVKC
jgi:hypothetical protein